MNSLTAVLRIATDILRGDSSPEERALGLPVSRATLAGAIVAFGMFYGAVMGTYGGFIGVRMWQVLYSAVKVPFLLFATFLLSLPSFFVINTLLGLRADFPRVVCASARHAGRADDHSFGAGTLHGVLVCLRQPLPARDPVQRRDVRRGQRECPMDAAAQL